MVILCTNIQKSLNGNIDKRIQQTIQTNNKKLKNLTKNKTLPFTPEETVHNLSSHQLNKEQLEILKNGLTFSSDILTTFEWLHYTVKDKLKKQEDASHLKIELAHIAQSYVSSYRPTPTDLKKHRILKNIRSNKDIIILEPDKGNGVVILDREIYKKSCYTITNNQS